MSIKSSQQTTGRKPAKRPVRLPITETGLINRIQKYRCPFSAVALGELFLNEGDFHNAKDAYFMATVEGSRAEGGTFDVNSARAVLDRMRQIEREASLMRDQVLSDACNELLLQLNDHPQEESEL